MYELIKWFKDPWPSFTWLWEYFLNTEAFWAAFIITAALVVVFFLISRFLSIISVFRKKR